ERAVSNVSPERLERYFLRRGDVYQVVPELRQMIVFAPHNVIKDPPFTRVDFVVCRNLLIYLQLGAQQKVLGLFHFALNRGGILFLGPSESPGVLAPDFEPLDRHWRIYRKFTDVRVPVDPRLGRGAAPRLTAGVAAAPVPRSGLTQLVATYDLLLDEFMPPGLLVNDRGELVHAFGGAGKYLRVSDGRQGLTLLDMVDPALRTVLVGSLPRALKDRAPVVLKGVPLAQGGVEAPHRVGIRPLVPRGAPPHFLVTIEPSEEQVAPSRRREHELDVGDAPRAELSALHAELAHTKESLQTVIEELETSNEELQAANEELLASNEELQSTNEELQSVNEELYTVNAEYQRKISELTELANDMDNLLSSTEVGSIFLDGELRIRKFTPQIAQSFKLLTRDVGRPIDAFTHNLDHEGLADDLRSVLATGERCEREVRDKHGRTFFLRILPYRAKGQVGGVVLTLIDVSGLKAAEDALFHERYLLNSLLSSVPDAIYFKDAQARFLRANEPMAARLGTYDAGELAGKSPFDVPARDLALALQAEDEVVLRSGEAQHYRLEERAGEGGAQAWDLATRLPLLSPEGSVVGVVGILRDVTAQKRAEEKIQEGVRRRDQFLAMLSLELRNPLGAVVAATALLKSGTSDHKGALVAVLDRQSQQMARLLDDLLEVSRVTQNKIELRRRVVELAPIVADAADAVRAQMDQRGISFAADLDRAPLPVDGDPARLQQIVANLLHNAAKYTPSGGHVSLTLRADGDRAVIRVRDDGAGIRRDMLDAVFDLFVQSQHTLDRAQGGLGVGLTLVRSLVSMHGGEVTASSDGEGKGAEFVVTLPLAAGRPLADPDKSRRPSPKLTRGASIVIVEDNADTREMLCEVLSLAGF
ncbi:MAG TPA: ATP-binding protein, partial [Minicystis sp.]|nr:ATP-binding protein [Minicystis sp.]